MSEASENQIGPPVDERSRIAVRANDRETSSLTLSTSRERAAYVAGRRVRLLYTMLLVVAAAAAGAWFAGTRIQSPAEMAARVAPPAPSPILVPVEEKVLSADVVTRGTARFGMSPKAARTCSSACSGRTSPTTTRMALLGAYQVS